MKPAPFTYHAPSTVPEVLQTLTECAPEGGRILAGGQSLVPLLNFRLAQAEHLVDINRVGELDYVRVDDGHLVVGARARQARVEHDHEVRRQAPLLAEALKLVAHPPIRHRGTICGSLAHADPAAELPAVALAMGGELLAASSRGERRIPLANFFAGPYSTALEADELLLEARLRLWPPGTGHAVVETRRTHGNFAVVGAFALVRPEDGRVAECAVAISGAGPTPVRASEVEQRLAGQELRGEVLAEAAEAAAAGLQPASDIHGTSAYRRKLATVNVRRALELAVERAERGGS